jgi:hypothetical protein
MFQSNFFSRFVLPHDSIAYTDGLSNNLDRILL